jgi:superfamily II DNA/RNA helicase
MTFSTLGLSSKVLAAVEASGYQNPTPIQAQAIPHVLAGKDVLGIAQTGTGKTASFVLPMLTRLEQGRARARMPRTLILEPTRELAAQVEENFGRYGQNHRLTVALLIGGVSFGDQDKKVDRGADVLIATPGRLLDHFERGKLLMSAVEILVIDEADRMLDMGFIPDIERICKLLPMTRQTLFFSATMPPEIQRLADKFLSAPVKVEVSRPATTVKTVTSSFVKTGRESHEKREVLRELIRTATDLKNAIIFCNRKRDVATLARSLQQHGFSAGALHGDMDQRSRMAMLDAFRKGEIPILVASDVAARGLDIPDVSHVFNFDAPSHAEDYVHRIGRTGRAGRSGTAFTLVSPLDSKYVSAIEKLTGDTLNWIEVTPSEASRSRPPREGAERRPRRDDRKPRRDRDRHRGPHHDLYQEITEGPGTMVEAGAASAAPVAEAPAETEAAEHRERGEGRQRRQRGGRGRERRGEPREQRAREERPREERAPAEARAPRENRQPREERPRRDRDRDRDNNRNEPRTVGLGDHVPQFLLRPTRLPTA